MNTDIFSELGDLLIKNNTGDDFVNPCDEWRQPQIVFGIIMSLMVVVGLIGNLLVFSIILILQEYKKSVTNWYILQLTLADTLFLLMLPFTAHSEVNGEWSFSLSLCKFKEAVLFINYYASIFFLVIMSFDRYLAVTKSFISKDWMSRLRTTRTAHIISIIAWILSILCSIQLFLYSTVTDCGRCEHNFPGDETDNIDYRDVLYAYFSPGQRDDSNNCAPPEIGSTFRAWIIGNFVGAFCLPFLLICFFYGMIMKTIRAASQVGNAERQRSYRRRVTMIVLALVALFAISWFPWYAHKLALLNGFSLPSNGCKDLQNAVRILSYCNSALNPYFYSFLGTHFRARLGRASTRIGVSAFRSRAALGSFIQKHKRSTSNSGGSAKASNRLSATQQPCKNNPENFDPDETNNPKFSLAPKTERTTVV